MHKILFFLFSLVFITSCGTGVKPITLEQTGGLDTLIESTGAINSSLPLPSPGDISSTPDAPKLTPQGNITSTGTATPVTSEKTEQDMEEFVDEANADIEALIEEIFQADEKK